MYFIKRSLFDTRDYLLEKMARLEKRSDLAGPAVVALIVLEVLCVGMLLYSTLMPEKAVNRFDLLKSPAFVSLASCDGGASECFDRFGPALMLEAKPFLFPEEYRQLEGCLIMGSRHTNGISLMLNIQTCFHQSEIIQERTSRSRAVAQWAMLAALVLTTFSVLQVVIVTCGHGISKDRELETSRLRAEVEELEATLREMASSSTKSNASTAATLHTIKDEIGYLRSRLGKGGDLRQELDYLYESIRLLRPMARNQWGISTGQLSALHSENRTPNVPSFDVTTPEGLQKWQQYVKQHSRAKIEGFSKPENPPLKSKALPSQNQTHGLVFSTLSTAVAEDSSTGISQENATPWDAHPTAKSPAPQIDFSTVQTKDKDGKPFRRVYIPGHGWVKNTKWEQFKQSLTNKSC